MSANSQLLSEKTPMLMGEAYEQLLTGQAHEHVLMGLAQEHLLMGQTHEQMLVDLAMAKIRIRTKASPT